ncbi:MAG: hypothetical protein ACI4JB_10105 [Porcipelethomonas sp.]
MSDYQNRFNDCEAVPIKVNRVFDSCSDKDCITGVQVKLTCPLPETATVVKTRCITVSDICINVEPIPFNKGFYSVDITFTFDVQLIAYDTACCSPKPISGTATVSKNCILFGSESNSKTFSSDGKTIGSTGECCNIVNPPKAYVQAVSPLVLESKITPVCRGSEYEEDTAVRRVLLTIGLFYVVELVRPVTIMVPAFDYTIPKKECCANTDTPCEVFDKLKFPTEEFSPSKLENQHCGWSTPSDWHIPEGGCGCQNNEKE